MREVSADAHTSVRKEPACWDEYANNTNPTEKQATESTRNTRGERLIQIKTHHGTRCPGERLK